MAGTTKKTSKSTSDSGLDTNLASMLCYLCSFVTGIIFLLIEKKDKTVRFHAWHAIFFGIANIILSVAMQIVGGIAFTISFWLSNAIWLLFSVVWLGVFALWLVLMIKAYQGSQLTLPIITEMAEKQANK